MNTLGFEIFRRSPSSYGLILKRTSAFGSLNKYFERYPKDTVMAQGEEALFTFGERDIPKVKEILEIQYWGEIA